MIDFGNLLSVGTAYPIAADKTGIFTAGGHTMAKYNLDVVEKILHLVESETAYFNSKGEVTYITTIENHSKIVTAKEFEGQYKKYVDAKVIIYKELMIK